jgi:hypothetical protein
MANKTTLIGLIAAAGAALVLIALPSAPASAAGCGCHTPPPPPPPACGCTHNHGHGGGGHNDHHGGGNTTLNVVTKVNVNAQVATTVNASTMVSSLLQTNQTGLTNAGVNLNGAAQTSGGGGAASFASPGAVSEVSLGVGGEERESYEADRTKIEKVVIQAFCFDDKDVPHPASQTSADREIAEGFEGEIYRCIAGTHMQVTVAPWRETVSFEGGQTLTCQKGEALFHTAGQGGGRLICRSQIPARDCNERSLLRRFGAGIKVLTIVMTEKYTAYRERSTSSGATTAMSFDGGVGGVMN